MTVIAIDGPAASGKGTLAKRIAEHLGYEWLDTGLLYRAVARDVLASGASADDKAAAMAAAGRLDPGSLEDPALRRRDMAEAASIVAAMPEVRALVLDYQRAFARRRPGVVMDGRDIGTVVCPEAEVKIFVTADARVRAERRYRELLANGEQTTLEQVLEKILARDRRDRERAVSPLMPAPDAILLDTSNLDIEAAFEVAIGLIKRKISQ
ncbi:MAG TPA: d(CMP) kinase [Hyphomicrobiaceae bacterium]|nr:d(CMP) kinase [Hyphomicrobiaceae bacterium]